MKKYNKFKKEKGAITLYVSIVCLFVLIVGITLYISISNKQIAQNEQLKEIETKYQVTLNQEELAKHYEGGDIVPIYTPEQFTAVGTGETQYVAETGKIYTFETDKTYMFYGEPEDITDVINEAIENNTGSSSSSEEQVIKILDYTVDSTITETIVGTVQSTNQETGETQNVTIDEYKELIVVIQFEEEFIVGINNYGKERLRVKVPILKEMKVAANDFSAVVGQDYPVGLYYNDEDGSLGVIIYGSGKEYRYQVYGIK